MSVLLFAAGVATGAGVVLILVALDTHRMERARRHAHTRAVALGRHLERTGQ